MTLGVSLTHEITVNAYYGFGPEGPVGDGGGGSEGRRFVSLGGAGCSSIGGGSSTNGGGCSSSFAKLKGWPFLCFTVTAPCIFFPSLVKVNFSVFSPEHCIDVITTTY